MKLKGNLFSASFSHERPTERQNNELYSYSMCGVVPSYGIERSQRVQLVYSSSTASFANGRRTLPSILYRRPLSFFTWADRHWISLR